MALSKNAKIGIGIGVGLFVLIIIIVIIILVVNSSSSTDTSSTDTLSTDTSSTDTETSVTTIAEDGTDSGSSSTSTPPANGVQVTAISPNLDDMFYKNDDITEDNGFQLNPPRTAADVDGILMDGKYFYFDGDEWDSNIGVRPMSGNTIAVQQWRDNGNRYENIWEGTINLDQDSGNGGRLDPWQYDQDPTLAWEYAFTNNANIWRVGDYIVYNGLAFDEAL